MPTTLNYLNFTYINLAFIAQILAMVFFKTAAEVQANWPEYRCNPPYWVFSTNITQDFNYCIQNSQMNMMGYLLEPVNYMISGLTSLGSDLSTSINGVRGMFSSMRFNISDSFQKIFGVFINIIIEFEKIAMSIQDMMGKIVGIVVTIMYVLEGSLMTMNSAWAGPTGQLVRSLGSCFHPDTKVKLKNGAIYKMKDLPVGAEMKDGGRIVSVMKLSNLMESPLYEIGGGVRNESVFVTGDHYIFDTRINKWIQVRNSAIAVKRPMLVPQELACLITTTRRIHIGSNLFWDWEDDELTSQ